MHATGYTSIAVVGLGNVGGQAAPLLASLPDIERVRLIDCDRYEAVNLGFQRLTPRDIGRPKAQVQARVLRGIRPELTVTAHACRFESVPLGLLRDSVILSCVDSRAARQSINRAAFALGSPWIDAALAREGSVRARVYLPGKGACLECAWGPRDYELLEQHLPCISAAPAPVATAAPLELGAIAAGLQMSLCRRLTTDASATETLAERQWFLDVGSGRGWTGRYYSEPCVPSRPHAWDITELGNGSIEMPLREALALAGPDPSQNSVAMPGMAFVQRLRCTKCRHVRRVHCRLSYRIGDRLCATCGEPLLAGAIDLDQDLSTQNTLGLGAPRAARAEGIYRRRHPRGEHGGGQPPFPTGLTGRTASMDMVFESWLERQYADGMSLCSLSDVLTLVSGPGRFPPRRFIAQFNSPTMVRAGAEVTRTEGFVVLLQFPTDYLRLARDAGQIVNLLAPVNAFHPNVAPPFICIGQVAPGTGSIELVFRVYEVLTFQKMAPREETRSTTMPASGRAGTCTSFP